MKRNFIIFFGFFLILSGCHISSYKKPVGDIYAYAIEKYPRGASQVILAKEFDNPIATIELGPYEPASITFIDPFMFVPTIHYSKGKFSKSNWVYYSNLNDGTVGRFAAGWCPLKVLPYQNYYVVLSDAGGNGVQVELYDKTLTLVRSTGELTEARSLDAESSLIIGDYLFLASGEGYRVNLDNLTISQINLPEQLGSLSLAQWNGKMIASDRSHLWIIDPETLAITEEREFPFERQGSGISLVVDDTLFVADSYSEQMICYHLDLSTQKQITLELDRWPNHLSLVGDQIYVSHIDGITVLNRAGDIIETKRVNGFSVSNFVTLEAK